MRWLTIVGMTPNGDGVVLSDDKGAKFLVANDPRLAAFTDHELSRQLEMALQTFSPREIQARVRAGASAEVIAAETGWPVDKVLRYAEPLLAERAYIAEQAQAVEIRRSGGGTTLLATATAAVGDDIDPESMTWDAFRRDDGKWIVSATYTGTDGPHSAQWTYDHAGRNIHPLDDDARLLMGVRRDVSPDEQFDAITDALGLSAERDGTAAPAPVADPRPRLVAVPDADETDDDTPADDTAARHSATTVTIPHPSGSDKPPADAPAADQPPAPAAKKAAPRKPKARRGRASVPSWDEILFGATRPDDQP